MIPDGKSKNAFRTIAETADILDVQQHVLRYWESQFEQVAPVKRAGNRRNYRPSDIALLAGLKQLLHVECYTLKGVHRILEQHGADHVAELGRQCLTDAGSTLFVGEQAETPNSDSEPAPQQTEAVIPVETVKSGHGESAESTGSHDAREHLAQEVSESADEDVPEIADSRSGALLTANEAQRISLLISRLLVLRNRTAADIEAARMKFGLASPT